MNTFTDWLPMVRRGLLGAALVLGGASTAIAVDPPPPPAVPQLAPLFPGADLVPGEALTAFAVDPPPPPAVPQPASPGAGLMLGGPGAALAVPERAPPSAATGEHLPGESKSRISDQAIGIQPVPDRPPLICEKHDPFLGPGFLSPGIELPTGAVWRPDLWVFGTNRLAFQYFQDHETADALELVNRLDLFAQLNLTGTERIVFAVRPFDHEVHNQRRYTRYDFTQKRYQDGFNLYPQTLFFEGDFGEIFPNLDPFDTKALDYGFSIGRQPVFFQGGTLINADILDAVTVTRNTLSGKGVLNSRVTFMWGWDRVHRNADLPFYLVDMPAHLFGVFTETDFVFSTVDVDLVYVCTPDDTTRDGIYFGISGTQRLPIGEHLVNNTARIVGSFPVEGETLQTGKGVLLFNELSVAPPGTEDVLYCTMFWAIGNFTSAARGVEMAGPLSPAGGILFTRPQIGVFDTAMDSFTEDVVGGAIGYQCLFDETRKQITFEMGVRQDTDGSNEAQIGFGVLYQQACGQHHILLLNGAVSKEESIDTAFGARVEWLTKF